MIGSNRLESAFSQQLGCGISIYSQEELERMHNASLYILQHVGMEILDDHARSVYADGGCRIDDQKKRVFIPPHVVESCTQKTPPHVAFKARNPKHDFLAGENRVSFIPFGVGLHMEDIHTREVRQATLDDLENAMRVCDALDGLDMNLAVVAPHDVPEHLVDLYATAAGFKNSSKHFWADGQGKEMASVQIKMAEMVAGGTKELKERPIFSFGVCPVSPLRLPPEATEVITLAAEYGIPVCVLSMAMAGATSPMTLAGTVALHNAEVLAGLVLTQLTAPGTQFYYGSSTTTFDMRYSAATVGAPEFGLLNASLAQMAKFYNVPSLVGGL